MDIFSSATWLSVDSNIGYGPQQIPNGRDEDITQLLVTWLKQDEGSRQITAQQILESQKFTLLAYSERMASLAVRVLDPNKIFFGLLALGIDGWRGDWRDSVSIVSLHYDAAKRIGKRPCDIFKEAGSFLPARVAAALNSFLERTPADQSLGAMGYSPASDADGFRYKRNW